MLKEVTDYMASNINLRRAKYALKRAILKKEPTDKDIHYPGALTCKLKVSKSVDWKDMKNLDQKNKLKPKKDK
jgi:hypothetical protein